MNETLEPVQPGERLPALDILRGFALFGVLLAYTTWSLGSPPAETYGARDRFLDLFLSAVIDSKFYTLFASLFGLGFSMQITRAAARGAPVVPLYARRLFVLVAIGLAHATLLRNGDILVPYAVLGFLLIPFRNASNRTLAAVAACALVYPTLARTAWLASGLSLPERPGETAGMGYLAENLAWVRYWYTGAVFSWPGTLPLMLFGLFLGRARRFERLAADGRRLRVVLAAGGLCGILAYAGRTWLVQAWDGAPLHLWHRLVLTLLWSLHAWGLAALYASSLLLLCQGSSWRRRLSPLGAVGRMSLTNYLLQAGIVVPVSLALGLFGTVTPTVAVLLAVAVGFVQVLFSVWWLRQFRFGPAEWVWRSLTYGSRQAMTSRPT